MSDLAAGSGLRVAIIGGGVIAAVHRRASLLAGAELVGVLGKTPVESQALAERWNVRQACTDLDALLGLEPDIVHICTPNSTHLPYALAVLAAGRSVICEKPLATTADAAATIVEAARAVEAAGGVAAVPFVYRYHPVVREIRARRLSGELGELYAIHGSYLQDWLLPADVGNWRVDPASGGPSRAFADIGSHWFDLVEWVSGERMSRVVAHTSVAIPERISARTPVGSVPGGPASEPVRVEVTTEDVAMLVATTDHGVPVSTTVSQVSAGRKNRLWFELDGSERSAVFDQENPETAWFGSFRSAEVFYRDPGAGSADQRRLATLPSGHPQGYAQCFEAFVCDAYATVRDGRRIEGLPTFADGLRIARITEAVLASARRREWVDVEN